MATVRSKAVKAKACKPAGTSKAMAAQFASAADPDKANAKAMMALRPSVNAAAIMVAYTKALGDQDVGALVDSLAGSMDDMWAGDMKRTEAMLYGQAHALQSIFMSLARRAASQEYLKQWEAYLRMALKAQNQCRMTLETLATIKNPPTVFARQANINNGGQQQVNYGLRPPASVVAAPFAPAANGVTEQSKLLEAHDAQRLDKRPQGVAGGVDPKVEAVGEVHRPAKS